MRAWSDLVERLRTLLLRRREEEEMEEEIRFHIEMETEKNLRAGMDPTEARREALRTFGGTDRTREQVRDARGTRLLEDGVRDLRFAARSLRKAPGFTAVAVGTLAVAIGATTAVFTLVDGVLLRPLAFERPERLVRFLEFQRDGGGRGTISAPNFEDWVERSGAFQSAALYDEWRPSLGSEEPERVPGAVVSPSFFRVLGVEPALGRSFLPEEEAPEAEEVVLSWGLWQERFGGDPGAVGSTVEADGTRYPIVGVAPPGMEEPGLQGASFDPPRLWIGSAAYFRGYSRGSRSLTAVGRLEEEVTLSRAREEVQAVHAALAEEYPEANRESVVELRPLTDDRVGEVRPALLALLVGVGLILLMACANVTNLLLLRASARQRELSLRAALGAARGRIVRQLLSESLLLAGLGGLLGVALALVGTDVLVALAAGEIPRVERVTMDLRILVFAAGTVLGVALLFGLLPALQATRPDLVEGLGAGGGSRGGTGDRSQGRLRATLVGLEVALAVVVVTSGGLLARSLLELRSVDPGIEVEDLLVMELDPPQDPYLTDGADSLGVRLSGLYDEILGRVEGLPGVRSAGMIDILPLSGSFNGLSYRLDEMEVPEGSETELRAVVPDFFSTMGIPRLRGRGLLPADDGTTPRVAVVNRVLAARHGGEEAVLGMHIHLYGEEPHRIVGVVGDVSEFSLERPPEATTYIPNAQAPGWMRDDQQLVVRTAGDPAELAAAVRAVVREIEPRAPVSDVTTMAGVLAGTLARERFRTVLLVAFSAVALLLAGVGVLGVVAYGVGRRRRELGVRMAMGASRAAVVRQVVAGGVRPVLVGVVAGLAGAWVAGRALSGLLFRIPPTDLVVFVGTPVLILAVAVVASWLPARQAVRQPVTEVLRTE